MEDLTFSYNQFKQELARFNALKDIDPKDDDALYKYLLHKLRDLREDILEILEEAKMELDSLKRIFDYEKEMIMSVNLD